MFHFGKMVQHTKGPPLSYMISTVVLCNLRTNFPILYEFSFVY